jgi:type II secretory pathway component GspD/PulD (secretin)
MLEPGGQMDYLTALLGKSPAEPNAKGFPAKRITEATAFAGTGGKGFYADQHIQALLSVMQTKGYGRILAKPKLLANDNQEGTIKTEDTRNIVQVKTGYQSTTATGGTLLTTSDVSFLASKAGIELKIKPHISKGNQLQLQITLVRTDFILRDDTVITTGDTKNTYPTPPDLTSSNVTTIVTVPNDTTIILGGLEKIVQAKGGTKIPLLGDIPLIGGLFRSTSNNDTQSRLYIFVKAHILRPGKEGEESLAVRKVSRENRASFEEYEKKFQQLEDWPGIKPQPMEPERILEAE